MLFLNLTDLIFFLLLLIFLLQMHARLVSQTEPERIKD